MGVVVATSDGDHFYSLAERLFPQHREYHVPDAAAAGLGQAEDAIGMLSGAAIRLGKHLDEWEEPRYRDEFASLFPQREFDRWREIADLSYGAFQSANVVMAAMCECQGLFDAEDGLDLAARQWDLIRTGFVLESVSQYLVSVGHYLSNIGLRVALDEPSVAGRVSGLPTRSRRIAEAAAESNSSDPRAWIYHSQAETLLQAIGGKSRALRPLRVAATLHRSSNWRPMAEARNHAFHRLRQEFPSRRAVEAQSVWDAHRLNRLALLTLGRALPSFVLGLQQASPRAARGKSKGNPLLGEEFTGVLVDGEVQWQPPTRKWTFRG